MEKEEEGDRERVREREAVKPHEASAIGTLAISQP